MNKLQRTRRRTIAWITLPILLLAVSVYGLAYGSVSIPLQEINQVLLHNDESTYRTILMDLRLPRVLVGLLVGACLAASGALLQGVMKNPLADPGIIGVSAGGGLAAVITMVMLPQLSYLLPVTAFLGAFLSAIVIYLLAWDRGASPVKIVLAGVAINALLGALTNGVMVMYSDRVQAVLPWLSGGLNGRSWHHLEFMAPYAIIGLIASLFAIKPANLLLLGDDSAQLLGQRVELQRMLIILLSALLAGTAVSVAGLIGFVGLVVPHVIRLLIGEDYRFLLPLSIVGGGTLVVLADTVARSWFDPIELPVGILLAVIGAPFFLILLKKRGNFG
ncbi:MULTISPECIES: FecCD family ABC transporter permease [Paenibacillus]|uniref:Fe3+-siderophore ABC transporter permease n=1 Tax=Paenibacillus polymyxa TaxID=1406 RepID=A0A378Y5G3_PAEPO|nr:MULTISPECIES: iron ABC transporter permease [Paenibacillus]MDP9678384.1 iron complex transport system permease protein [Paenibacillus jamilae]AHM67917.1 iron ABC transporter permease [Paenibacillus polymyxa SQR-21]AUS28548.1 iron ABC transporter permease [Paenibacillus polymyxa]KAF6654584.1 iron ABC transporter permease [Paenibacillus sp. EKM301P]MBE7900338.1 iron ABC transporter permease [Paenibacillus polymyxa]